MAPKTTSSNFIQSSSLDYALYVAMSRAIPRVNDGLKHVQRTALWLLRNKADKIKTVALGGEMAKEKLYVHGDVSATAGISALAAPYRNNVPLIRGHGQFGSRVAPIDGIADPRYTEVSRSRVAEALLYPDCNIVPLKPNYDGSNVEPEFFTPLIPTVLLNGVSGIAVGWSTNILPRSLGGLIQATQDALDGKRVIRGLEPSFARFRVRITTVGPNQYEFVGSVCLTDSSTITVTELPPGVSIENFRKRLIEMEDSEKIAGFADRSADAINIAVRFKRGSVKDWTEQRAIDFFKLTEKVTERIVVLNWEGNRIMTYSDPQRLVRDFVEWRLDWYKRRFETLVLHDSAELSYWELLKLLFESGFAKKFGSFANKAAMEAEVRAIASKKKKIVDEVALGRVLNLPTYRWTKEFGDEIDQRIAAIQADLHRYRAILGDKKKLKAIYASELDGLKKLKFD